MNPTSGRPAMTGRMPKVCMYCGDHYGFIPCVPAQDGRESHGVCHALPCRQRTADDHGVPLEFVQKFFADEDRESAVEAGREAALRRAQGGKAAAPSEACLRKWERGGA
jgi:hypothetical protein